MNSVSRLRTLRSVSCRGPPAGATSATVQPVSRKRRRVAHRRSLACKWRPACSVGFCFARYLPAAFAGDAPLALLGRSPLDAQNQNQLRELESLGAKAFYVQADVSVSRSLEAALNQVRSTFGPLEGIIHGAGIMGAHSLLSKGLQEFQQVTAAKIRGAYLLDELTRADNLKYFVLFSSLAATVGDLGYGDYGAGNRFLDEFAVVRERWRAAGLRQGVSVSIEWPMWEAGGMQFVEQGRELFHRTTGMTPLTESSGTNLLPIALASGQPVLLAAAGNLNKLTAYLTGSAVTTPQTGELQPTSVEPLELLGATPAKAAPHPDGGGSCACRPSGSTQPQASASTGFDSITLKELAHVIGSRWQISSSVPPSSSRTARLRDFDGAHLLKEFPTAVAASLERAPGDRNTSRKAALLGARTNTVPMKKLHPY